MYRKVNAKSNKQKTRKNENHTENNKQFSSFNNQNEID